MITIKIIKELSRNYIRGNRSRFNNRILKELHKAKVGDLMDIEEKYLPQFASFAVLKDGTKIEPLKVLAVSTITTTNGEMLIGVYGGNKKISDGAYNVTVDDATDIVYARLVRVTNTNSIDIINNFYAYEDGADVSAPGGSNYSVEFFDTDFQFLGKTPLFSISNDYSDIETGDPVITEDFTGTTEDSLQLTLTMSPLYDGFAYDNSFDALNWKTSTITLNGDLNNLQGWIDDGIAVISGDNSEVLTITYPSIVNHWLVGISFIWCNASRKKINKTYNYPPFSGSVDSPEATFTTPVVTDTTGVGNADGTASTTITITDFTGQGTAEISPDPNDTNPTNLDDGDNDVSWEDLPAGDYHVDIKDDDTIIGDGIDFTISDPITGATATIDNVTPTDATTTGGTDGSITFDTTISDFTGDGTATLTPKAGTTAIALVDGENTDLLFDTLPADTYTITILDDDNVIITEEDIVVGEPTTEPSIIVENIETTDTTGAGNADGSATADVTISDFTGQGTAEISPDPNTVSPISLDDGLNNLSFDTLPADDYTVTVKDDTTDIDSFNFTISDPVVPATGTFANTVPAAPTTEDGTDGSINFDVNVSGCTGDATATLNPVGDTTPITLTDGDNNGLSFDNLVAGDYTLQIYCDSTLVEESDTITVPAFVAPTI